MAKTAIFLSDDSIDVLETILYAHQATINERAHLWPPLVTASAINDVETIRKALADRVREV